MNNSDDDYNDNDNNRDSLSNKRIKLSEERKEQQKQQQQCDDIFSMTIRQFPIVERLIEFGINPAVLRRVTATLFRETIYLKQLEQLIEPKYSNEEWANAIACSMLDWNDWLGLRRDFCDEFPLRGGGHTNRPCVVLTPVHDSDLPFELDCHINIIEPADTIWLNHVDSDRGPESLDPMTGCPCCQTRPISEYIEETRDMHEHSHITVDVRNVMKFRDTPFAEKFACNAESMRDDFQYHRRFEWVNGRYMRTFRFTVNVTARAGENAAAPTKDDIVALLLHIFATFGAPRATTVHTVATECLMLAIRFARRPMISTVLLCSGIRALIPQRIPPAGGILLAERLVTRATLASLACINRQKSHAVNVDANDEDLQIDDKKILEMQEWDFNVKLQHTRHHVANCLRAMGDLLCRAALYWRREHRRPQ